MLGEAVPTLKKIRCKLQVSKHYSENIILIIWLGLSFTQHDQNLVFVFILTFSLVIRNAVESVSHFKY